MRLIDYINSTLFVLLVIAVIGLTWNTVWLWVRIIITILLLFGVFNFFLADNEEKKDYE